MSVQQAAEDVVLLNLPEVTAWRDQGWVKDGIVWNADPSTLITPWTGHRPPSPCDPALTSGEGLYWRVGEPSRDEDPRWAALQDLRSWVEHPMWASTALVRRTTFPIPLIRYGLRWAAGWVVAPDCFAHIEAFVWPREDPHHGLPLRGMPRVPDGSALPGQRYLRIGEVTVAPAGDYSSIISSRPQDLALMSVPPESALHDRVGRDGVAWFDRERLTPDRFFSLEQATLDRMTHLLHEALDHAG